MCSDERFHHDIVSSTVAVRPRLAIARDARVYESGVDLCQTFIVEAVLFEAAWQVVLDQDVRVLDKLGYNVDAGLFLEREGERLFVSIDLLPKRSETCLVVSSSELHTDR